jgi:hypothetical protein
VISRHLRQSIRLEWRWCKRADNPLPEARGGKCNACGAEGVRPTAFGPDRGIFDSNFPPDGRCRQMYWPRHSAIWRGWASSSIRLGKSRRLVGNDWSSKQRLSNTPWYGICLGSSAVGIETADMLVHEVLLRPMRDRKAVARYAGLTGSPDESGTKRREQGLARAGNAPRHDPTRFQLGPKLTPRCSFPPIPG